MKIIAFITNHSETRKILNHIKDENVRPLPLSSALTPAAVQDGWFADYIPTIEQYIRGPEYVN